MHKFLNLLAVPGFGSLVLIACSVGGEITQTLETQTSPAPAPTVEVTEATVEVTEASLSVPAEATINEPEKASGASLQVGAIADFSASNDSYGIEGSVEIISDTQIVISGFVSFLAKAPGVDIRLGLDGDFSDAVALSLIDITGEDFDGRTLTLTLPPGTLGSGLYDSIAVFCFDANVLFDSAVFVAP